MVVLSFAGDAAPPDADEDDVDVVGCSMRRRADSQTECLMSASMQERSKSRQSHADERFFVADQVKQMTI